MLGLLLAAFLQSSPPIPNLIVVTPSPAVLGGNYEPGFPPDCAGYPHGSPCQESLFGIYYPAGEGPDGLGYPDEGAPVFIALRGGNENWFAPGMLNWFNLHVLPHGFVGVDPLFSVIDGHGEDYKTPVADVGYLIQWLRYYSGWLNIDPNKIFLFGRSGGGLITLGVGLREDHQDLASADPIRHESSRPNFIVPFSAPSSIVCMEPVTLSQDDEWMGTFFPVSYKLTATFTLPPNSDPSLAGQKLHHAFIAIHLFGPQLIPFASNPASLTFVP